MLTWKYALLELEINAVLTQHLRKKLALDLLNKLIDSIAKSEIAFESGMSVQI